MKMTLVEMLERQFQSSHISTDTIASQFFNIKRKTLKNYISNNKITGEFAEQLIAGTVSVSTLAKYIEDSRVNEKSM
ncbi:MULTISPECIES: hypothetical protein [Pseudoalteromonas]|uniref:hypothetical protein n=1 Tax=Pseudoalteromonas TaxID=53246 RepID=UPI00165F0AEB|nr:MULTISPECIES: hypothetical protein [Pseudoalteromonas]MCK8134692.1 pyocin activator PrtN family protein [Pseudoalteromonas sp. 2CM28B]